MPIKVQADLPAIKVLESENIFVMPEDVAIKQDIRPLKIVIVNLMPTKIETETQLLRLLGNNPLQVDIELLQMATHQSKNTSEMHLTKFYKTFDEIKNQRFDGNLQIKLRHSPFQFHLDLVSIILIDIKNNQLLRICSSDLPAKLTANGSATTGDHNHFPGNVSHNLV